VLSQRAILFIDWNKRPVDFYTPLNCKIYRKQNTAKSPLNKFMLIPDVGIKPDEEDSPKSFFHHHGIFSMPWKLNTPTLHRLFGYLGFPSKAAITTPRL
jgi:hypothetical protein